MEHVRVNSAADAWRIAARFFPTDYIKNEESSKRAGYPIYETTSTDEQFSGFHISDLNTRLELNMGNDTVTIWIEDAKENAPTPEWGIEPEKTKKVKNVIKGYMSRCDIKQLTVIEDDDDSVIFSGNIEKFLHPCDTMQDEAKRIKEAAVKRVLEFNEEKLFIFI